VGKNGWAEYGEEIVSADMYQCWICVPEEKGDQKVLLTQKIMSENERD
jgi:hypothetical protein